MADLKKYKVDINVPSEVLYVLKQLRYSEYEAYLVGGCVRDSLLGRTPHDWDVCTNATPDEMQEVFKYEDVIETGLKHGTLTVMISGTPIEVTTYRTDGDYSDHRHPSIVTFVTSLENDLSRRDFTVNAMAYDCQSHEVLDYFGGVDDIKHKIIRCVGNPDDRFNEDALRMLRALRFSVVLSSEDSWGISQDICDAIEKNAQLLNYVSKERISEELTKMLSVQNHRTFPIVTLINLLGATVVPEFTYYQDVNPNILTLWGKIAEQICSLQSDSNLIINLNLLLHFKVDVQADILKRLKFSNEVINGVTSASKVFNQLKNHFMLILDGRITSQEYSVKLVLRDYGPTAVKNGINVLKATESLYKDTRDKAAEYLAAYTLIMGANECFSLKELAINGNDVMKCGFYGKEVGDVLNKLLNKVMLREIQNKRESLLRELRYMKEELNK